MKNIRTFEPRPLTLAITTALALASMGSSTVFAQAGRAEDIPIEEVIIKAERRDTRERTTAISMEVLTGDNLAENQIKDMEDLQKTIPNIQFNTNGAGWAQANIRGVGNPSSGGPGEQVGVPILFDGGTQGEEVGLGGGFFDIGNVQVLRGPQGTFIGQSAAGGAILVSSARPNFDGVNGYIEGTVGTYSQRKMTGAVNLPISDTLAGRIAFLSDSRGSFYHNQAGGQQSKGVDYEIGSSSNNDMRLTILWEPSEKFTLYGKLEQTNFDLNGNPTQPNSEPYTGYRDDDGDPLTPPVPVTTYSRHYQGPAPGTGVPGTGRPGQIIGGTPGPGGVLLAPLEPYEIAHPVDEHQTQKNTRYIIDFSYGFDSGISFNGTTSYIKNEVSSIGGWGDSRAYGTPFQLRLGPEVNTVSQEFTLLSAEDQRLEWLVGAAASKRHTEVGVSFDTLEFFKPSCGWEYDGSWSPCPTFGTPASQNYIDSDTIIESQGLFAQLNWHLTDEIELTGGARWNRDDNTALGTSFWAGNPFAPPLTAENGVLCPGVGGSLGLYCPLTPRDMDAPNATRDEYHETTPTYKFGVNWEPGDNQFLYAFYARGYKAGQATRIIKATGLPDPSTIPITEEIVDDYEIGWKGTLLGGAFYGELGYFRMDYTDMQLTGYSTSSTTSGSRIQNIGDSSIEGFEGSLRTSIGNLNISGSFGYTKSRLGNISTYESRAFILPNVSQGVTIGDTSKGCMVSGNQACFDFSPYQLSLSGKENLNSPKWSYNLTADYPFNLKNGALLTPRLNFSHADKNYTDIRQVEGDNYYTRKARDLINLSLSYDYEAWSVQAFVNNLNNEVYNEAAGDSVLYGDPRVSGVRIRMNF